MSPARERPLWFFGAAAVAAASLGLVLIPAPGHLSRLQESLNDARAKKEIALRQGATFAALEETRKGLEQQRAELDQHFVSTDTAVTFLSELDTLAAETGVSADVQFTQEPEAGVRKVPLTVTVGGPLSDRLNFLERITARTPAVVVDSVEIASSPQPALIVHAQVAWR
jgi:hypothetical protein